MIIPARAYRFTEQVIHNGCVVVVISIMMQVRVLLLVGFGGCSSACCSTLSLLFGCCVSSAFVSLSLVGSGCSHVYPRVLDPDGGLSSLLVHLVLHKDGF